MGFQTIIAAQCPTKDSKTAWEASRSGEPKPFKVVKFHSSEKVKLNYSTNLKVSKEYFCKVPSVVFTDYLVAIDFA